ncbi:MAG: YabP/YqfC family sporulation protein [Hydrogeniiclostridium mannosilyticum]
MEGLGRLRLENYKSILEFTSTCLRVQTEQGVFCFQDSTFHPICQQSRDFIEEQFVPYALRRKHTSSHASWPVR